MEKILILVDCQNDFIDGSLGTKEAQEIVPNIVEKIKEYNNIEKSLICITKDTHNINYLFTQEGKNLPVKHCIKGQTGWQLNKDIEQAIKEYQKTHKTITFLKDTFGSYELATEIYGMYCNNSNIEIEIVGLCTDICVISNAILIKNTDKEMKVTVDSKCCAGVNQEKHLAALEVMRSNQIYVK